MLGKDVAEKRSDEVSERKTSLNVKEKSSFDKVETEVR